MRPSGECALGMVSLAGVIPWQGCESSVKDVGLARRTLHRDHFSRGSVALTSESPGNFEVSIDLAAN